MNVFGVCEMIECLNLEMGRSTMVYYIISIPILGIYLLLNATATAHLYQSDAQPRHQPIQPIHSTTLDETPLFG